MIRTIRIAIVGAGNMAIEHAKAFSALEGVLIVGVLGKTAERAVALAQVHGATVFTSMREMYEVAQPDVVVITTNELATRDVCYEAFKYPWICLVEKPVGINLDEALAIDRRAIELNGRVFVGLNRRSYEATRHVVRELAADSSSRLVSVIDQQDTRHARSLGKPEAVLANYMYANSIHLIDYFNIFCRGNVVSVRKVSRGPEMEFVAALVEFDSGDVGSYQAVWNRPGPWAVSVSSSHLRFEMRPLESVTEQRLGSRQISPIQLSGIDNDYKPGLYTQAQQIVDLARGGHVVSVPTLSEANRSMRLCALIYGHSLEC